MMVAQVPHRLPKVLFRKRAKNLGGRPFVLRLLGAEQDPPTPDAVLGPPHGEANGDSLSIETYGGEVVNDGFARSGTAESCRLCGHAEPMAGLR